MNILTLLLLFAVSTSTYANCVIPCQITPHTPPKVVIVKDKNKDVQNTSNSTNIPTNSTATSSSQATTGQQSVIINLPTHSPIVKTRIIKKTLLRTKKVVLYKPNRLQLFLGQSKTKLEIETDNCCNLTAKRKYEPDLGIQYLRDFGYFTGSIIGTINKNYYLGVGFNW